MSPALRYGYFLVVNVNRSLDFHVFALVDFLYSLECVLYCDLFVHAPCLFLVFAAKTGVEDESHEIGVVEE